MCLGIPGRIVEIMAGNAGQLAMVDVLGAQRPINLGMLEDPHLSPGDWVLIHMGFALEQIDEAGARKALSGLRMMGSPGDDGLATDRLAADQLADQDAGDGWDRPPSGTHLPSGTRSPSGTPPTMPTVRERGAPCA